MQVGDIERYFQEADRYVEEVIESFTDTFDQFIEKEPSWKANGQVIGKTPRQLLIHSITHEFHHKGQIVAMLRLLNHTPENTDILVLE